MASASDKPVDRRPLTRLEWAVEFAAATILLLMFVKIAGVYPELPQTIPVHFNAAGQVDDYGSKATIWLLPVVGSVIYALLTVLVRFPKSFNYPVPITEANASRQYHLAISLLRWLKLEVLAIYTAIAWAMIDVATTSADRGLSIAFLPVALVMVFCTLARYLVQALRAK